MYHLKTINITLHLAYAMHCMNNTARHILLSIYITMLDLKIW